MVDVSKSDETLKFEELCNQVREVIDEKALGDKAWYLLVASVLVASPSPELLAPFYTYLTTKTTIFSTPESQTKLSHELRDLLLKQITILGAPQVLSALIPFVRAESSSSSSSSANSTSKTDDPQPPPRPSASTSTPSPGLVHLTNSSISEIHERGHKCIDSIYGELLPKIYDTFGRHSTDFQFTTIFTEYGLYFSDNTYLTPVEVELVLLVAIMCLGFRGPSLWHVRGMGRLLGARGTDETVEAVRRAKDVIRGIKIASMATVEFCGEEMVRRAKLDSWVNVGDVVREIEGGWGEDKFVEPGRGNVYQ